MKLQTHSSIFSRHVHHWNSLPPNVVGLQLQARVVTSFKRRQQYKTWALAFKTSLNELIKVKLKQIQLLGITVYLLLFITITVLAVVVM